MATDPPAQPPTARETSEQLIAEVQSTVARWIGLVTSDGSLSGIAGDKCYEAIEKLSHSLRAAEQAKAAAMLRRVLARVDDGTLDWTGAGCCPFCEVAPFPVIQPPCELRAIVSAAHSPTAPAPAEQEKAEDSVRLDWMERAGIGVDYPSGNGVTVAWGLNHRHERATADTLRAAIDSAIARQATEGRDNG